MADNNENKSEEIENDQVDQEIEKFIEENKNNPSELANLLLDMPRWKKPDLDIVKRLLSLGVSVNSRVNGNIVEGTCGASVLVDASGRGHLEFVRILLDNGADIESKSPWDGRTALMDASLHGHFSVVELLISRKANVNAIGYGGTTALIWAAKSGFNKIVKLLRQSGAGRNHKDDKDEWL